MQKVPSKDKRKLLPRWRPLSRVPAVELASWRKPQHASTDFMEELKRTEGQWNESQQLEDGVEYLESAIASGGEAEASGAARALIGTGDLRPMGLAMAKRILGQNETVPTDAATRIRQAKRLLEAYPKNGVLRTQMALAYVSTGQRGPAQKQIEAALRISPRNRFVLRSAARFFVHDGLPDHALHAVVKAARTDDPWILATQVSLADMQRDNRAFRAKDVRNLLNSDIAPEQLVELAVAFATLEIANGAIKPARKLISKYGRYLNENAAAQLKWIEENDRVGFDIDVTQVKDSFEASTLYYHNNGEWLKALTMAQGWFSDEPFSTRAAILGSYIASAYAGRHDIAIGLVDGALVANPNDVGLMNNKAFALSQVGDIDGASAWLVKAQSQSSDNENRVVLLATEANILVRAGSVLDGLKLYATAAAQAAQEHLFETRDRMVAHWLSEMYAHGYYLDDDVLSKFRDHFSLPQVSLEAKRLFQHIALPAITSAVADDSLVAMSIENDRVLYVDDAH